MNEKKLRIFLSYAAEQREIAKAIESAFRELGQIVFFDKKSLPAGKEFHRRIINEIKTSDVFVFLISPDSIRKGEYARSELKFAKKYNRRIFPVMVIPVELSMLPGHINSTTVLIPEGNLVAELIDNVFEPEIETITDVITNIQESVKRNTRSDLINQLDQNWDKIKEKYTVKINGYDTGEVPSTTQTATPLIIGVIMTIFFFLFSVSLFELSPFVILFSLFPLGVGLAGTIIMNRKINEYEQLEEEYHNRRSEIEKMLNDQNDIVGYSQNDK